MQLGFWNNIKATMRQPVKLDNIHSGRTFVKNGIYGYGGPTEETSGDIRIGNDVQAKSDKYIEDAVPSTAIQSIEWDPKTENAKVQFRGGNKNYDYPMTREELDSFLTADSKGRWINQARTY